MSNNCDFQVDSQRETARSASDQDRDGAAADNDNAAWAWAAAEPRIGPTKGTMAQTGKH